ncbi:binding-protein-dependent transport systems inner membrane component [Xylanimonas cellulosilytica DSM 15894]|uniref:Binding-protein-dependent transport systems inner membrane component n=1 Tax=Xylanimonas cellulosilytica (strain DSM 15894 / JCM 12276 / CECT 5975 / KCTC 9989 / LMG 20990 / NBRC 107835 / XIL07) TaxID=446471 RepID=D1BUR2_XYLCX|nr:ABC transporter permease [Xylanimonas cellulosilytica]ACZ29303.1 binding-protein-dependent transport systems inner membrane component [Xylanimonas cellulosilytica DSM 15894]
MTTPPTTDVVVATPRRRRNETLYFALRNPKVVGAIVIVGGLLLLGVLGPMFLSYGPTERIPGAAMKPPGSEHWFGTTMQGHDVFTQFVVGLRATFVVGVLGAAISGLIGMLVGFVAGYRGGVVDDLLNMLTNIVLVIPGFVVLIIINAYMGVRSIPMQAIFIGLSSWPWVARAVRSQTLSLRSRDYIDLARTSGLGTAAIIRREIAPNMYSYLFMTFVLLFGGSVLTAAALDFIGLGPTGRNAMSLGLMMNQAVQWSALTLNMWWWFLVPGAGITVIVGSLYIMNVGLDEVFNPKLREM